LALARLLRDDRIGAGLQRLARFVARGAGGRETDCRVGAEGQALFLALESVVGPEQLSLVPPRLLARPSLRSNSPRRAIRRRQQEVPAGTPGSSAGYGRRRRALRGWHRPSRP